MPADFHPVRMPKRTLTPEHAAKFAALREEIETELASRRGDRVGGRPGRRRFPRMRHGRWSSSAVADERPRGWRLLARARVAERAATSRHTTQDER